MSNKLEEARRIIDKVDAQIAELFVERMRAAELVYTYKQEHGLPIFDPRREEAVLEKNSALVEDAVLKEYYLDYMKNLMAISKAYQHRMHRGLTDSHSHFDTACDAAVGEKRNTESAFGENSFTVEVGQTIHMRCCFG